MIGRGAVAPSQTLPKGPPSTATAGTNGGIATKNQKTVSRKEPERTATTNPKETSGGKSEDNPLRLCALKPPQRRQSATEGRKGSFPPSLVQKGARMLF